MAEGVSIRRATTADRLDILRVLDGAMLEVDTAVLDDRIPAGTVLVALAERGGDRDPVVAGALVTSPVSPSDPVDSADGTAVRIEAVAVRQSRRGRGIGSALVERAVADAAAAGYDRLVAEYDVTLRSFYDDLGFHVTETMADGERVRGVCSLTDEPDGSVDD